MSNYSPDSPSVATQRHFDRIRKELPFEDTRDLDDAARGFIGTCDTSHLVNDAGNRIWDLKKFEFLDDDSAEGSVNPSLLRLARLNNQNGLFEVAEGVYQVRGFDLSNVTFVESDTGVIVIDPLVSVEVAALALKLYREHRGDRKVNALIYTHSHLDHYGGSKGIVSDKEVASGQVRVIAPEGFLYEAVAENVFAGNAMARRAIFMYGALLPAGPLGTVDAGLGKTNSIGQLSLIAPTEYVQQTGEMLNVDGIEIEFTMAPHTEAPSEFILWFPKWKLLNAAEDVTHTMHNVLTPRGAQVRDTVAWWKALHVLLGRYGAEVEVLIAQHHWPVWGNEAVREIVADQRDMYKYLHDEVLRLTNNGYTIFEIPELIELPEALSKKWYNRDYYGSLHHNAKAVYQRYLGWWDGNPSTYYAHSPEEGSKRFVELAGGADAILEKLQPSFDEGDYRWVAEVANKLVFADPSNMAARELGARALEQLAYQQENPTWRNIFLAGAWELVNGTPASIPTSLASTDIVSAMTPELLLDFLSIRLNGPKAAAHRATIRWALPETGAEYLLELRNGVIVYSIAEAGDGGEADATLTAPKLLFAGLVNGSLTVDQALAQPGTSFDGDRDPLDFVFSMLDEFPQMFNIIEP